jgi:predicted nucleic acid-binding protein
MSGEFCDTNILVYAYDRSAGAKHARASQLVIGLWQARQGVISVQVLQEFFTIVTRKIAAPLSVTDARAIVVDLAAWRTIAPVAADVLAAIDFHARWQVSFWDAMVLVAARKARANLVWSEDLSHGQEYDGILVRNPFVTP